MRPEVGKRVESNIRASGGVNESINQVGNSSGSSDLGQLIENLSPSLVFLPSPVEELGVVPISRFKLQLPPRDARAEFLQNGIHELSQIMLVRNFCSERACDQAFNPSPLEIGQLPAAPVFQYSGVRRWLSGAQWLTGIVM